MYQDRYLIGFGYEYAEERQIDARFVVTATADSPEVAVATVTDLKLAAAPGIVYEVFDQTADRFSENFRPSGRGVDFRDGRG